MLTSQSVLASTVKFFWQHFMSGSTAAHNRYVFVCLLLLRLSINYGRVIGQRVPHTLSFCSCWPGIQQGKKGKYHKVCSKERTKVAQLEQNGKSIAAWSSAAKTFAPIMPASLPNMPYVDRPDTCTLFHSSTCKPDTVDAVPTLW